MAVVRISKMEALNIGYLNVIKFKNYFREIQKTTWQQCEVCIRFRFHKNKY
jgi:hypothetical protein